MPGCGSPSKSKSLASRSLSAITCTSRHEAPSLRARSEAIWKAPPAAAVLMSVVDAAVGFARLRIASQRGGRGTAPERAASELIEEDCPAFLRTLELTT